MGEALSADDDATPRTIIHDATLATYEPDALPDFDVFRAVVDESAHSVALAGGVDA